MGAITVTDTLRLVRSDDADTLYHNGDILLQVHHTEGVTIDNRPSYARYVEEGGPMHRPSRWQRVRRWVVNLVALK